MKKILSIVLFLLLVGCEDSTNTEVMKGENGASAYDIAVSEGFNGTKTDWLDSLKGSSVFKGDKGDIGLQGPKGDPGANGGQGIQGVAGKDGSTILFYDSETETQPTPAKEGDFVVDKKTWKTFRAETVDSELKFVEKGTIKGDSAITNTTFDKTSDEAVSAKAIQGELDNKANTNDVYTKTEVDGKVFDKDYNKLINKPTLFSGSWDDLQDKPSIPEGSVVDATFSDTSTNAVQNKVVKSALDNKVDKVANHGLISDTDKDQINVNKNKMTEKADIAAVNSALDNKANKTELFDKKYSSLTGTPTTITAEQASAITANTAKVDTKNTINNTVESDATDESLSAAQGKHLNQRINSNFGQIQTNQTHISNKVDKVVGKGLSTNDFTDADHTKLDGLNNITVENVLTSDSTANALSANQGKVLDSKISNKADTSALSAKADTSAVNSALSSKADTSALNAKADTSALNDLVKKDGTVKMAGALNFNGFVGKVIDFYNGTSEYFIELAANTLKYVSTVTHEFYAGTTKLFTITNGLIKSEVDLDMSGKKIKNVADGVADTDAVNFSQLKAKASSSDVSDLEGRITGNTNQISGNASILNTEVIKKDGSVKMTGALQFNSNGSVNDATGNVFWSDANQIAFARLLNMTNKKIAFLGAPDYGHEAANKAYVDTKVAEVAGGGSAITVDTSLDGASTNPVQNKVVKAALDSKGDFKSDGTTTMTGPLHLAAGGQNYLSVIGTGNTRTLKIRGRDAIQLVVKNATTGDDQSLLWSDAGAIHIEKTMDMEGNRIGGLSNPTFSTDAVNKQYVDGKTIGNSITLQLGSNFNYTTKMLADFGIPNTFKGVLLITAVVQNTFTPVVSKLVAINNGGLNGDVITMSTTNNESSVVSIVFQQSESGKITITDNSSIQDATDVKITIKRMSM